MRIARRWIHTRFKKRNPSILAPPQKELLPGVNHFLEQLPKAEIHLHFEGAVGADVLLHLGRKYQLSRIRTRSDAEWVLYVTHPQKFFEQFLFVSSLFREADDFYQAALDLGHRLHRDKIHYVELTLAPHKFVRAGIPYPAILEAIDNGLRDAPGSDRRQHNFIIDIVRDLGPELGMEMIRMVEQHPHSRVMGIGLGGGEQYPAADSKDVFQYAQSIGLRKTAHAGEGRGAESIWDAVRSLGVERIDHGVRAWEDPSLVAYLRDHKIPLNQCPTSNVMLGVVSELESHPLRSYYDQGVPLTVGTDDPAFFKVSLTDELRKLILFQRFQPEEIPPLIENALRYSFMDEGAKEAWINRYRRESKALLAAMQSSGAETTSRSAS